MTIEPQQRLHVAVRSGRRPKVIEDRRTCAQDGCDTVLSKYNLGEQCRVHTEIRFPRIRGRG